MKLKVTEILEAKNPYQPQGKSYKVYEWLVSGELDGIAKKCINVKTFAEFDLQLLEYEIEAGKEYNGVIPYIIKTHSGDSGFKKGGWSKPVYTLQEYDDIFNHAIDFIVNHFLEISPEIQQAYVCTYIISAVNAGVKINQPVQNTAIEPLSKFMKFNAIQEKVKSDPKLKAEWDSELKQLGGGAGTITEVKTEELYQKYVKNL